MEGPGKIQEPKVTDGFRPVELDSQQDDKDLELTKWDAIPTERMTKAWGLIKSFNAVYADKLAKPVWITKEGQFTTYGSSEKSNWAWLANSVTRVTRTSFFKQQIAAMVATITEELTALRAKRVMSLQDAGEKLVDAVCLEAEFFVQELKRLEGAIEEAQGYAAIHTATRADKQGFAEAVNGQFDGLLSEVRNAYQAIAKTKLAIETASDGSSQEAESSEDVSSEVQRLLEEEKRMQQEEIARLKALLEQQQQAQSSPASLNEKQIKVVQDSRPVAAASPMPQAPKKKPLPPCLEQYIAPLDPKKKKLKGQGKGEDATTKALMAHPQAIQTKIEGYTEKQEQFSEIVTCFQETGRELDSLRRQLGVDMPQKCEAQQLAGGPPPPPPPPAFGNAGGPPPPPPPPPAFGNAGGPPPPPPPPGFSGPVAKAKKKSLLMKRPERKQAAKVVLSETVQKRLQLASLKDARSEARKELLQALFGAELTTYDTAGLTDSTILKYAAVFTKQCQARIKTLTSQKRKALKLKAAKGAKSGKSEKKVADYMPKLEKPIKDLTSDWRLFCLRLKGINRAYTALAGLGARMDSAGSEDLLSLQENFLAKEKEIATLESERDDFGAKVSKAAKLLGRLVNQPDKWAAIDAATIDPDELEALVLEARDIVQSAEANPKSQQKLLRKLNGRPAKKPASATWSSGRSRRKISSQERDDLMSFVSNFGQSPG